MSYRYAVLWEPGDDHPARPVGLCVEQDGYVLVEARDDLEMPARYDEPFHVMAPGMKMSTVAPGDDQYFDQVVLDLSRAFIIGKEGRVGIATADVVLGLLSEFVFRPLRREHAAVYYEHAGSYPTVRQYQAKYYQDGSVTTDSEGESAAASDGSLVVA